MSYGIARVGDTITGSCTGAYKVYEATGVSPIVTNADGSTSGGDPIYGWVTYSETGVVEGVIETGSPEVKADGKAVARVGDTVSITKKYSNGNHLDPLTITGTISSGSNKVFADGKAVAYSGCFVTGDSNCSNITINSGSNSVFVDE